jgi:cyanophycin synthetase
VAERVRDDGFVILNADSIPLQTVIEKNELTSHGRKLVLFSRNLNAEIIQRHIEEGHRAYVCHDGSLFEFHNHQRTFIIDVNEIPLTVGGTAAFQIENVLAAFAACDVMEVPLRECLEGLRTFHSAANAGRSNLYKFDDGYALIDYGHNPEAIRAIGHMLTEWQVSKTTLVLGVPGDRSDEMIRLSGIAAANFFDKIIIREDNDRRGRNPGEVADLLYRAIKETSPDADARIVLDPVHSLESAFDFIEKNELIVYLYEDISVPEKIIRERGGVPLHDFSRFIPIRETGIHEVQAWQ